MNVKGNTVRCRTELLLNQQKTKINQLRREKGVGKVIAAPILF